VCKHYVSCSAKRTPASLASRDAMDIDGLGESIVENLVDMGLVKNIADLYKLSVQDLLTLLDWLSALPQSFMRIYSDPKTDRFLECFMVWAYRVLD